MFTNWLNKMQVIIIWCTRREQDYRGWLNEIQCFMLAKFYYFLGIYYTENTVNITYAASYISYCIAGIVLAN